MAQQRYTDASQLLGRRFFDEITNVFRRIIEHPLRYKQFDPPARRLFANGFPYAVMSAKFALAGLSRTPACVVIVYKGIERPLTAAVGDLYGLTCQAV